MADDLSPLVNLDLINKIYKTINAQINERVYDPLYNSKATLGDVNHRYVNAYLKALNVNGDATITGDVTSIKNIAATTFNNLTLEPKTSGFKISGGASKALTIVDTANINNPLTVGATTNISAATTVSAELTVSAATSITKGLTVNAATTIGTTSTGAVEIKSGGTEKTTIIGPNNGSVTFTTPTSDLQGAVKIGSASSTSTIGVSASKYLKVYTDTEIGGKTNTGKVSIQPNGANALTINGPSDGKTVTLKSGTCVVESEYATENTANKLVKRDGNNIKVTSVNNVTIAADDNSNTNRIDLKKGTAKIAVDASTATLSKDLTVNSITVLGDSTATGSVTVKSAGVKATTIVGPEDGTATLAKGTYTAIVEESFDTESIANTLVKRDTNGNILAGKVNGITLTDDTASFTVTGGSSTSKTLAINSSTTLGSSTASENGPVTVKSAGTGSTTITGPSGKEAILIDGSYKDSAITENSVTPTVGKLLKIGKVSAKKVLIGPKDDGADDAPSYRPLEASDLPTVPCGKGGTGITTYTTGDILYASASNTLSRLGKGSNGQVLKMSNGVPAWGTNDTVTQAVVTTTNSYPILASATADAKATITTTSVFASGITITPSSNTIAAKTFKGDLSGNAASASTITTNNWPESVENDDGTKTAFIGYVTVVDEAGTGKSVCVSRDSDSGKGVSIERKETTTTEGTTATYHLYAGAVHNAVWNDLADCIEVPEDTDLEFGYCYSWNGDRVEKTSRKSKNCIGIHSNTAGLFMGEKPVKTIQAAVAGFALAYTDKAYPEGTPLTWSDDGKLTKCNLLKRLTHPERVIATFYKEEKQESWHGVKVNKRHWVKIR